MIDPQPPIEFVIQTATPQIVSPAIAFNWGVFWGNAASVAIGASLAFLFNWLLSHFGRRHTDNHEMRKEKIALFDMRYAVLLAMNRVVDSARNNDRSLADATAGVLAVDRLEFLFQDPQPIMGAMWKIIDLADEVLDRTAADTLAGGVPPDPDMRALTEAHNELKKLLKPYIMLATAKE